MRRVTQVFSSEQLAAEAGVSSDLVDWLAGIGVIRPREPGAFRYSDVSRDRVVAAGDLASIAGSSPGSIKPTSLFLSITFEERGHQMNSERLEQRQQSSNQRPL